MTVVTFHDGDPSSLMPVPAFEIPMVLYTRVSSDDSDDERSCDEQEADMRGDVAVYVQRMREPLAIVAALRDPNVPASRYSTKDRPDWFRMLQMMRDDQVKVVGFWEMSRATRRLTEWAQFADLAEDKGTHVFLRGRMYDCANPSDMGYLTDLVTRGIQEVAQTRERVQRAVRNQAERGRPGGKPVFGLRSVYDDRTGALINHFPDEEPWPRPNGPWTQAGLVREAVSRVLSGESLWSITADWNSQGIPASKGGKWETSSLKQILISTSIMGKRTHHGVLIDDGGWKGVISKKEFYDLQDIFSRTKGQGRQRDRNAGLKYYFSSVVKCGVCGEWAYPGKVAKKTALVFRCPTKPGRRGGCVTRTISRLEEHIEALLVAELSRPDIMMRFEKPVDEEQVARDQGRISELRAQEQEALSQSLVPGPGRLPVMDLMRIRASLAQEREMLQARVDAAGGRGVPQSLRHVVGGGPGLVLGRWRELSVEQKRSLLRDVTDSVHLLPVGLVGRRKLMPSESVDIRFVGDPAFELLG